MNNTELKNLRDKYNSLRNVKHENMQILSKLNELEENCIVIEYKRLLDRLESDKSYSFYGIEKLSDDQILEKIINNLEIEDAEDFYVYAGTYEEGKEIVVDYDSKNASFSRYFNIESCTVYEIDIENREEFEKENADIHLLKEDSINEKFQDIRKEYFKKLVGICGKQKAKEYVLREKNINDHFRRKI